MTTARPHQDNQLNKGAYRRRSTGARFDRSIARRMICPNNNHWISSSTSSHATPILYLFFLRPSNNKKKFLSCLSNSLPLGAHALVATTAHAPFAGCLQYRGPPRHSKGRRCSKMTRVPPACCPLLRAVVTTTAHVPVTGCLQHYGLLRHSKRPSLQQNAVAAVGVFLNGCSNRQDR